MISTIRILIHAYNRETYLQYPGTISTERVASVYDMPVFRETCEKIANTLQ